VYRARVETSTPQPIVALPLPDKPSIAILPARIRSVSAMRGRCRGADRPRAAWGRIRERWSRAAAAFPSLCLFQRTRDAGQLRHRRRRAGGQAHALR
jgi:hypothetical protein